jgi:hypothetical protein
MCRSTFLLPDRSGIGQDRRVPRGCHVFQRRTVREYNFLSANELRIDKPLPSSRATDFFGKCTCFQGP